MLAHMYLFGMPLAIGSPKVAGIKALIFSAVDVKLKSRNRLTSLFLWGGRE